MKLSYNWLKQYVRHDLTPEGLADALTMSGLEIEEVETIGSSFEGVVVGHVLSTRRHPNADRLTLCQVDLGDHEPVQIVCGAPNVAAGQKVPVALVGTTLHLPSRKDPSVREPVTLDRRPIRGEVSNGMICAEDELGLSDDHSGIMVLAPDAQPGRPFADYLAGAGRETSDAVLDVNITPNRPDATSHLGIARDVAALTGSRAIRPEVSLPEPGGEAARMVTVDIEAPEACRRYVAMVVRGVKIQESPEWLKQRLLAIGLRPRNNVVDITNFVMYECGQPLHAFDFNQVAGRRIVVRHAEPGELFVTLDSKKRTLTEGMLLICDNERPVAIAGVMGGENSEVTDATTDVLIESAYFDPSSIRKTSKMLALQTDSSYRFERGIDPEGQVWAAARAASLMVEMGGGEIVPGMVDAHPNPVERRTVALRFDRVNRVLGVEIAPAEVERILTALGFEVKADGTGVLSCGVPPFRPDVEREIDIIEEVARIFGYDRIPEPERSQAPAIPPRVAPTDILRERARHLLAGLGFRETYTNSLLRKDTADLFADPVLSAGTEQGEAVETLNPISQEMAALRASLVPGMLQVIGFNRNHGRRVLRFMEFGHVFRRSSKADVLVPGYAEHESLLVAMSGSANEPGWDTPDRPVDYFDLKGIVERLLEVLHVDGLELEPVQQETPTTTYHVRLKAGGRPVGIVARLSDAMADRFDLREPVYFAEFHWPTLVEVATPALRATYEPVTRFPAVERDLAVIVPRTKLAGDLLETIRKAGGPLLRTVSVFDLYEGKGIEPDRKSLAFTLRFGADRTLQDQEVDARVQSILAALGKEHGAQLRQ